MIDYGGITLSTNKNNIFTPDCSVSYTSISNNFATNKQIESLKKEISYLTKRIKRQKWKNATRK